MSILLPLQQICERCVVIAKKDKDKEITKDRRNALRKFFTTYRPVDPTGNKKAVYVNRFTEALCEYFECMIPKCDTGTTVGVEVYMDFAGEIDLKKKIDLVVQGKKGRVAIEIKHTVDFNHLAAAMTEVALSIKYGGNFKQREGNEGEETPSRSKLAFEENNIKEIKYYIISSFVNSNVDGYKNISDVTPKLFSIYEEHNNNIKIRNLMFIGREFRVSEKNEKKGHL